MTCLASFPAAGHSLLTKNSRPGRGTSVVRPILKKLAHLEKNSLDLDRGWDEQSIGVANYVWRETDDPPSALVSATATTTFSLSDPYHYIHYHPSRSARDVTFTSSAIDLSSAVAVTANSGRRYTHVRSTSVTSHLSVATTGSGIVSPNKLGGSFVHPFQQIPIASTPPLSYPNSLASLDTGLPVNSVAAITTTVVTAVNASATTIPITTTPISLYEDEDGNDYLCHRSHNMSLVSAFSLSHPHTIPYSATSSSAFRRPSLASQGNDSVIDIFFPATAHVKSTNKIASPTSTPAISAAITALATTTGTPTALSHRDASTRSALCMASTNRTEVQSTVSSSLDSPGGLSLAHAATSGPVLASIAATASSTKSSASPIVCSTPFSPARRSFDTGFRSRSRSEVVDSSTRQEQLREARRRFEEKERAKEQKYARDQVRKRVRADSKEAQRHDGGPLHSFTHRASPPAHNSSSTIDLARSAPSGLDSHKDDCEEISGEKIGFASQRYDLAHEGQEPRAGNVVFELAPRRRNKRKTRSAWTQFILWLRTKLLRMTRP